MACCSWVVVVLHSQIPCTDCDMPMTSYSNWSASVAWGVAESRPHNGPSSCQNFAIEMLGVAGRHSLWGGFGDRSEARMLHFPIEI